MKTIINIICFLVVVALCWYFGFLCGYNHCAHKLHKYIAKLEVEAKKIRSVGETQQQLIDAGYGDVWANGEIRQLKVDYIWGPNTTKAYGNWKAADWDWCYEK